MSTEVFYLVWTPSGSNPTKRHASHSKAKDEAKRLAAQHPGREFFTLRATSISTSAAVTTKAIPDEVTDTWNSQLSAYRRASLYNPYRFIF